MKTSFLKMWTTQWATQWATLTEGRCRSGWWRLLQNWFHQWWWRAWGRWRWGRGCSRRSKRLSGRRRETGDLWRRDRGRYIVIIWLMIHGKVPLEFWAEKQCRDVCPPGGSIATFTVLYICVVIMALKQVWISVKWCEHILIVVWTSVLMCIK